MKALGVLILSVFVIQSVHATHLAGGHISVKQINTNSYEISINLSRDTATGSATLNALKYTLYKTDYSFFFTKNISFQLIPSVTLNGQPQNVELYQAKDTVNFLAPGGYKVKVEQCCMPGPFNNASINRDFYLETYFSVFSNYVLNSGPVLLSPAINVVPVNQIFKFNIHAFDQDGDELEFRVIHPLEGDSVAIPFWTEPSADSLFPFQVESFSGEVTWKPNQIGRFLVTFEIVEYRNRLPIGRVLINQTFIVVADSSQIPEVSNFHTFPLDTNGYHCVQLIPNQNYSHTLFAVDADSDSINILAYGEPFFVSGSKATMFVLNNTSGQAQAVLNWIPDSASVRKNKFKITYRVQDKNYTQDYVLFIKVGNLVQGIDTYNVIENLSVFPNPATYFINIEIKVKKSGTLDFKLQNINGQEVIHETNKQLRKGKNIIKIPLKTVNGVYNLGVYSNDNLLISKPILILNN